MSKRITIRIKVDYDHADIRFERMDGADGASVYLSPSQPEPGDAPNVSYYDLTVDG